MADISEADRRLNVESRILAVLSHHGGERIIASPEMDRLVAELRVAGMNDTEEIVAKWLQVCPPCDAGIGAPCTHPDEDERPLIARLLRERDEALAKLAEVWGLHTDSPAGVCPSCARLNDVSDTDDGLVAWPCPTILAIDPGVGE